MDKTESTDLLIRIDERVLSLSAKVDAIDTRISGLQCASVAERVAQVEEKTKNNTRVVWGGLLASLATLGYIIKVAVVKALTP